MLLVGLALQLASGCSTSACLDSRYRDADVACVPVLAIEPSQTQIYSDLVPDPISLTVSNLSGARSLAASLVIGPDAVALPLSGLSLRLGADVVPVVNRPEGFAAARQLLPAEQPFQQAGFNVQLLVPQSAFAAAPVGPAELRVSDGGTATTVLQLHRRLGLRRQWQQVAMESAPTPLSSGYFPYFRKIGNVGSDLYALQAKPDTQIVQMFRYRFAGASFSRSALMGALNWPGSIPLVDFAASRLFLLSNVLNRGLQFISCPEDPADLSMAPCVSLDSGPVPGGAPRLLPIATTALSVSLDATWAAVAVDSAVYTAPLPMSGLLDWRVITETPWPASPKVEQLALARLMGEVPSLVVVRAGDIRVYILSAPNTWTLEQGATTSLSAAVAGAPVDALALGDVDGDRLTDVVVVKGTRVIPIINLGGGQFRASQSVDLPVNPGESMISATCAVAQVNGPAGNDLVVAYTTMTGTSVFVQRIVAFLNPN